MLALKILGEVAKLADDVIICDIYVSAFDGLDDVRIEASRDDDASGRVEHADYFSGWSMRENNLYLVHDLLFRFTWWKVAKALREQDDGFCLCRRLDVFDTGGIEEAWKSSSSVSWDLGRTLTEECPLVSWTDVASRLRPAIRGGRGSLMMLGHSGHRRLKEDRTGWYVCFGEGGCGCRREGEQ